MKGNFDKIINADKPVLVDFSAEWCGPCKMLAPIIKQVAKRIRDDVRVIKIDIDKNPVLANRFQIRGVPTLALFRDGKVLWRQSGVMTEEAIVKQVMQMLAHVEQ